MSYHEAIASGLGMDLYLEAQQVNIFANLIKLMNLSVNKITDSMDNNAVVFADPCNIVKLKEIAQNIQTVEEIMPPFLPIPSSPEKHTDHPALGDVLKVSKYEAVRKIEWKEYNSEISCFVNASWQRKKGMRVAIPALFAGALLVEGHQALYITCVEAYCRSPNTDTHCECHHDAESRRSHPEGIEYNKNGVYNDACIRIAWDHNVPQLKIGLRTATLLVVGCIRIDMNDCASIGPANNIFKPTNCTRIFFGPKNIQKAKDLCEANIGEITDGHYYAYLRQLRSKFDHESTYFICRAGADGFLPHRDWPVTIWTYADMESKRNRASSARLASSLFIEVATCVFEHHKLSHKTVENIFKKMEKTNSAKKNL
jgi:hypothetical protein